MRFLKWITISMALVAVPFVTAGAQTVSDSDFISIESVTLPLNKDTTFSVVVSISNQTPVSAITLPLTFAGHPGLSIDTSVNDGGGNLGITHEILGQDADFLIKSSLVDFDSQTILIGYVAFFGGLPAGSSGPLVRIHFKLDSTAQSGVVTIDSTLIPPSNHLTLTDELANEYVPQFTPGVLTIGTPAPSIDLSPTSLSFSSIIGTPNPASQIFTVSNKGVGTLNWTVADDQPWIDVAPPSGTNTGDVTVSVNTAGLAAGTHTGTVTVTDPLADNSPQTVSVTLTLDKPSLFSVPTAVNMVAEAGGPNPSPVDINLNASSSAAISWTASKASTWLSAAPTSGTTPSVITASANITGLSAGTYRDTIVVTSANATNSPYKIPVLLTLTEPPADLQVTPTTVSLTATEGGANPTAQAVDINNVGGGTLNWTISGDGPWSTVSSSAGTAPSTVMVGADITGLTAGSYVDTLVVDASTALNSPQNVIVNLTVNEPPPVIALAPTTLTFNAIEGGANPATQAVDVSNSGGGTLSFTVGSDQAWLSAVPTSGTAPQTLDVSVDITGLTAGTYNGHIIVTAAGASNSPESVAVALEVLANPPVLVVDPTSAAFTATEGDATSTPPSVAINISNTGGGTLNFTVEGVDAPWLNLSATAGTAPASINLSADPAGMIAGSYADTIQIVSPGTVDAPADVIVTFEVAAGPPEIALSPLTFTFNATEGGANPANQTLNITNSGGSTPLNWGASTDTGWLSLSAVNGTAPSAVDVIVDITGLSAGTHVGHISVTGTGAINSPQVAEVTLIIGEQPPHIVVAPTSLSFSATLGDSDPAAQSLAISNSGGMTLNWTAADDQPWLSVAPGSGSGAGSVDVSVALAGLTPGTYNGNVTISDPAADNSPVTIPVTLELADQPAELSVSPTSLTFNGQKEFPNPPAQNFNISNIGGSTLDWTLSGGAVWLSYSPTSGSGDASISVNVDHTSLSAGTYEDSIMVDAGGVTGSPAYVHVTFIVAPAPDPSIAVSPGSMNFTALFGGSNPASQVLNITNAGGQTLNWDAAVSSSWLSVSPASGTAPSAIDVSVDITGLSVGMYYDTIVVSSAFADNSPQMVPVQLEVTDNPPQIVVSPTALYFEAVLGGSDPLAQSFDISNTGAGTLNWTATKNSPWLSLSSAAGTAPSTVDVSVALGSLSPGTYRDTIVVASGDAINSPQTCIVTFLVKDVEKPRLELQPDSLYFIVQQGEVSDPQCIYVFIDGNGGRAVWRGLTDASWIDLSRDSCNLSYPVCVTVDAFGFEPGVYCDSVEFTGDISNGPQYLHVCMDVRSGGDQPVLVVRDTMYEFTVVAGSDALSDPQSFTVSNSGTGTLSWNASTLASYLIVDPLSGTAPSSGSLRIDPISLSAGTYDATVDFTAPGALNSPTSIHVHVTATEPTTNPHIVVSPTSFEHTAEVGTGTASQVFNVTNSGGGILDFTASASEPWLDFPGGNSGTAPASFTAEITIDGLTAGVYYDTIWVASAAADNSPVGIPVMLTLAEGLTYNDSVWVDAGHTITPGNTEIVPVYFENDEPLYGISVPLIFPSEGITVDSVSFVGTRVESVDVLAAGINNDSMTITIGVIPTTTPAVPRGSGMLAKIYFAADTKAPNQTVPIDTTSFETPSVSLLYVDTGTNEIIPGFGAANLTVEGALAPELAVSPDSLAFEGSEGGANPAPQYLHVENLGSGPLTFTVSESIPWLSVSPGSGNKGDSVAVTVDLTGLAQGSYSGSIEFNSPEASNDPILVPVTLVVAVGPPLIVVEPTSLSFSAEEGGSNPVAQSVTVTNSGGGTLAWTASTSDVWLSAVPTSGGDGTSVDISVDITGLAEGTYNGTVTFTDASAANSPVDLPVELNVIGPASPDTVTIASVEAAPGTTVDVPLRIKNTFTVAGITIPLKYTGTGVRLVSGEVTSRSDATVFTIFTQEIDSLVNQTALFGFIAFAVGMPPGDGDVLTLHFEIAPDAPSQVITIDTTFLPPSNHLSLVDGVANEYFPEFEAGHITVTGAGANGVWITEATGESGNDVTVDVYAENSLSIERLLLPLKLTSADVSIVSADFAGTRSASGTPALTVTDDQNFTIEVDWSGTPLAAGSGRIATLTLALAADAPIQTAYVDTAGEFGFIPAGNSNSLVVPAFTRGTVYVSSVTDVGDDWLRPGAFALRQNFPNPFNPSTSIEYNLAAPGQTRLSVYNLLGQQVVVLVNDFQAAGAHSVVWDGRDSRGDVVPSGIYLYRLESGDKVAHMKMTLMK